MTLLFHYFFFFCVSFEYVLIPASVLPARPVSLFVCPHNIHYFFFSYNFLPKGEISRLSRSPVMCVYTYVCVYMCMYVGVYCVCVCMYVCLYVYIYLYVYVCTSVCMCVLRICERVLVCVLLIFFLTFEPVD